MRMLGPAVRGAGARLLPSVRDIVLLLPLLFLFARVDGLRGLLGDGDTGWHVRTGEWMLQHRAIPRQDIFSFTRPGEPWFAWEWLWELSFGWLHLRAGMEAVLLVNLAILSITLWCLYRECCRRSGDFIVSFGFVFLAAAGSVIHWLARPHLVSLLFAVVTLGVLDRARAGRPRLLLLLPALTVLWVNLHGGFFIGWTFAAAYAAGEALSALAGGLNPWRRARPYVAALGGSMVASLANPHGWRLHAHIFGYLTDSYHRNGILEFQSFDFHSAEAVYVGLFLIFGGAAVLWYAQSRRFSEALILAGWAWLALYSGRNIPVYLFAAAPLLSLAVSGMIAASEASWLKSFRAWRAEVEPLELAPRIPALSAAVFLALALAAYAPDPPRSLRARFDPGRYPEAALGAVAALGPSARVFADDEWGDFLSYRLYPGFKVFIDGRSDFYGPKLGEDLERAFLARHDWEQILGRHRIDAVLLPVAAPLAGVLKECARWRVAYDDGVAILFRPAPGLTRDRSIAATVNLTQIPVTR